MNANRFLTYERFARKRKIFKSLSVPISFLKAQEMLHFNSTNPFFRDKLFIFYKQPSPTHYEEGEEAFQSLLYYLMR